MLRSSGVYVIISTPLPGSHAGRAGSGIVGVTSGALAEGAFLQGNLGSRYGRSGHSGSPPCCARRDLIIPHVRFPYSRWILISRSLSDKLASSYSSQEYLFKSLSCSIACSRAALAMVASLAAYLVAALSLNMGLMNVSIATAEKMIVQALAVTAVVVQILLLILVLRTGVFSV